MYVIVWKLLHIHSITCTMRRRVILMGVYVYLWVRVFFVLSIFRKLELSLDGSIFNCYLFFSFLLIFSLLVCCSLQTYNVKSRATYLFRSRAIYLPTWNKKKTLLPNDDLVTAAKILNGGICHIQYARLMYFFLLVVVILCFWFADAGFHWCFFHTTKVNVTKCPWMDKWNFF